MPRDLPPALVPPAGPCGVRSDRALWGMLFPWQSSLQDHKSRPAADLAVEALDGGSSAWLAWPVDSTEASSVL